jgi:Tfp pilus assembly protein PilN
MIVQQVNLYQDSLKQKHLGAGFYLGAILIIIFFILFGIVNIYLLRNLYSERELVEQTRQKLNAEQARVKLLGSTLPKHEVNSALIAELELWQKKIEDTNKTLDILRNNDTARSQGFSAYFQALANLAVSEIWLTVINFDVQQQRINFEGSTLKTDKIPYFLQQLQQEPVFHGRTFAQLQIEKIEKTPNLVNFKLSTHLEPVKKDHVQ